MAILTDSPQVQFLLQDQGWTSTATSGELQIFDLQWCKTWHSTSFSWNLKRMVSKRNLFLWCHFQVIYVKRGRVTCQTLDHTTQSESASAFILNPAVGAFLGVGCNICGALSTLPIRDTHACTQAHKRWQQRGRGRTIMIINNNNNNNNNNSINCMLAMVSFPESNTSGFKKKIKTVTIQIHTMDKFKSSDFKSLVGWVENIISTRITTQTTHYERDESLNKSPCFGHMTRPGSLALKNGKSSITHSKFLVQSHTFIWIWVLSSWSIVLNHS